MKNNKNKKINGQVMLLSSLIIGGSILAATSVAGYLMLLRVRASTDITNSSKAIAAASSGVDWALYQYFIEGKKDFSGLKMPEFGNKAEVKVTIKPALAGGYVISSVGKSGKSYRAFEFNIP